MRRRARDVEVCSRSFSQAGEPAWRSGRASHRQFHGGGLLSVRRAVNRLGERTFAADIWRTRVRWFVSVAQSTLQPRG